MYNTRSTCTPQKTNCLTWSKAILIVHKIRLHVGKLERSSVYDTTPPARRIEKVLVVLSIRSIIFISSEGNIHVALSSHPRIRDRILVNSSNKMSTTVTPDNWVEILTLYVCPSIGCVLAALMYLSPIADLSRAIRRGDVGHLPTLPWALGLTNCWGWSLYGYLTQNIFVMLSNVPGLILSIYLNFGAIKLQYYTLWKEHTSSKDSASKASTKTDYESLSQKDDGTENNSVSSLLSSKSTDTFLTTSGLTDQERVLYPLLLFWIIYSVIVGFFAPKTETTTAIVGWTCNANLVFFYGVPIQILRKVVRSGDASAIHRPTLAMTATNATFWMIYGIEIQNPVIAAPNALGAILGLTQVVAVLVYPTNRNPSAKTVAKEGQALLEAVVENLDEQVYEPLTPKITSRKDPAYIEHPIEVLVPAPIKSAMIV